MKDRYIEILMYISLLLGAAFSFYGYEHSSILFGSGLTFCFISFFLWIGNNNKETKNDQGTDTSS